MFSSSDSPEEGTPSDSLPEEKIKKQRRKHPSQTKSPIQIGHRPRMLSFPERVEAWHEHTLGMGIPDLAIRFQTTITEVQTALELAAQELGYPHNHIDPELERFKIVTASDHMKTAQIKLLQRSHETLKEIERQQKELKRQRESIIFDTKPTEDELDLIESIMRAEAALEARNQAEVKSQISIMAEYRATNLVIADLTGIKKTKPVRKAKPVRSIEDELENLTDKQLSELIEVE